MSRMTLLFFVTTKVISICVRKARKEKHKQKEENKKVLIIS